MCKGGCNFRVRNAGKAEVKLPYKVYISPVDVALYTVVNQDRYNIIMHKPLCYSIIIML